VFFVPQHRPAADRSQAFALLRTFSRSDFARTAIIETTPSDPALPGPPGAAAGPAEAQIKVASWKSGEIELDVEAGQPGFVVVAGNDHPGWQAQVDGKQQKIYRANYIMRAVVVEAGRHRVRMVFRPSLAVAGVYATLAGWPLLLAAWGAVLLKRKKHPGGPPGP
jgi:hypothetical protein